MSYQVLARKYRPRIFREMVGQEHVLQALINALDHKRLHHAYLFTGTRGVGKTTIARILAKCLNCEQGVSSEPCGQCGACVEIGEGRFVDLIEVDAASKTKVEDTRELLDNVQYAPSRGRYKVYLIDEVHMLSNSSFNALLKTLEEPPPHVKFLLATTDPQKLPVTVLSRCLQFNLKNMSPERIVGHLQQVLEQELVPFEEPALWQLGRAADGSMRDALSLTDQAIAFGSGKIQDVDVRAMLGTLDQAHVVAICQALAAQDGTQVLSVVAQMSEQAPAYDSALAELLGLLHRVAIAQAVPEAVDNSGGDKAQVLALAAQIAPEDVQLFYQTALLGRRDLPLSPDPRGGFEMVLLRMLAFKPQGVPQVPSNRLQAQAPNPAAQPQAAQAPAAAPQPTQPQPAAPIAEQAPAAALPPVMEPSAPRQEPSAPIQEPSAPQPQPSAPQQQPSASQQQPSVPQPQHPAPQKQPSAPEPPPPVVLAEPQTAAPAAADAAQPPAPTVLPPAQAISWEQLSADNWFELYRQLKFGGVLQSTASNVVLQGRNGDELNFCLDQNNSHLYDTAHQGRMAQIIGAYFERPVSVLIKPGQPAQQTPAAIIAELKRQRQAEAEAAIATDPNIIRLIEEFDAKLVDDSVEPMGPDPLAN